MLTLESFKREWKNCQKCPLHVGVAHHVLYRGEIPAEVMLVGEAPGKVENRLGRPFVGPSGDLLNSALDRLGLSSFCICNVVCCIPWRSKEAQVIRQPSKEEAAACNPHLVQLVQLCQPKLVICLGNEAKKHFPTKEFEKTPLTFLRHPAYILRNGGKASIEYKRFLEAFHAALDGVGIPCNNPFMQMV